MATSKYDKLSRRQIAYIDFLKTQIEAEAYKPYAGDIVGLIQIIDKLLGQPIFREEDGIISEEH